MKWSFFVKKLQEQGFDGDGEDFGEVQSWLRENGHDPSFIQVKGQQVVLREMYNNREGKALDFSSAADEAAKQEEIERIAQRKVDELIGSGAIVPQRKMSEYHPHQVKVGKDRIEDDPCVGYRKFGELGFGQFLEDVRKQAICVREGRMDEIPKTLTKSQQVMTKIGTGLNEFIDSEGGFLVPPEHREELLKRVYNTGQIFPRARQVPMTSRTLEIPYVVESSRATGSRHGGVRGYWTDEGTTYTASQPAFGKLTLTAHKLTALGYVTDELAEDSNPAALQMLGEMFSEELAFLLDQACLNGTGAGQPLGITTAPCFVQATRTTVNRLRGEDIVNMWAQFYNRDRASAVWFTQNDVLPDLIMLSAVPQGGGTASAAFLNSPFISGAGLSGAQPMTLLGAPVVVVEQNAALGSANRIVLCDMSQYLLGMRRGINTSQSIHVRFLFDEVAFKASMRVDGQPWWQSALTPFAGANALSPFVGLTD